MIYVPFESSCDAHLCGLRYILSFFLCSLFFKQEMELSLIGLQNAGKTSLVNVIAVSNYTIPNRTLNTYYWLLTYLLPYIGYCWWPIFLPGCNLQTGGYSEDMIPTVRYYLWYLIVSVLHYWNQFWFVSVTLFYTIAYFYSSPQSILSSAGRI